MVLNNLISIINVLIKTVLRRTLVYRLSQENSCKIPAVQMIFKHYFIWRSASTTIVVIVEVYIHVLISFYWEIQLSDNKNKNVHSDKTNKQTNKHQNRKTDQQNN